MDVVTPHQLYRQVYKCFVLATYSHCHFFAFFKCLALHIIGQANIAVSEQLHRFDFILQGEDFP